MHEISCINNIMCTIELWYLGVKARMKMLLYSTENEKNNDSNSYEF